ncbi:hypothetical protein JW698_03170 [Candidatus Wolfebacteria bacterium]|nr:hypothetical protein [Candidatus Wolfebacteria bacterium]
MFSKVLILIIILFVLIGLFLVYNYFILPEIEKMVAKMFNSFQGPEEIPNENSISSFLTGYLDNQPIKNNGSSTIKEINEFHGPNGNPPSVDGPTGPPPGSR